MKQASAPVMTEQLYSELSGTMLEQSYWLQENLHLKKHLADERDKHAVLYKKYHRRVNTLDGIDTTLLTASMGMGIKDVRTLPTIIAAPVVLGLEIAALACGNLGIAGKFIGHWLAVKAKKHDEARFLEESKLNSIFDHVSSTLMDGRISDEEFRLVVDEVTKYQQLYSGIQAGAKRAHATVQLDEETKTSPNKARMKPGLDSWQSWPWGLVVLLSWHAVTTFRLSRVCCPA